MHPHFYVMLITASFLSLYDLTSFSLAFSTNQYVVFFLQYSVFTFGQSCKFYLVWLEYLLTGSHHKYTLMQSKHFFDGLLSIGGSWLSYCNMCLS